MILLSHLHLVLRVNLLSQAQVAVFQVVVLHPLAAQAHRAAHHLRVLHVRALHLVHHLAAAHFQVLQALSHHRAHASHRLAQAHHLAILHSAQAVRAPASQALVLRVAAVLHLVLVLHPSAAQAHRAIQLSLHPALLAAHLAALHLHLRVRALQSCKASISILIVTKAAIPLLLWDLERLSQVE